jgi:hypothetical protein
MILDHQYQLHEDTKGIPLPDLAKVNKINLGTVSEVYTLNGYPATLCWLGHGILLHANRASLAVVFDEFLGDIVVLFFAVPPYSLLIHVTIASMPLINAIKYPLFRNNNSTNCAFLCAS